MALSFSYRLSPIGIPFMWSHVLLEKKLEENRGLLIKIVAGQVRGSCEGIVMLETHAGVLLILRCVPRQGWRTEHHDVNHSKHPLHQCLCSTAGAWSDSRTSELLLGPGGARVCHGGFFPPLPCPLLTCAIAMAAAGPSKREELRSNQSLVRTAGGTRDSPGPRGSLLFLESTRGT